MRQKFALFLLSFVLVVAVLVSGLNVRFGWNGAPPAQAAGSDAANGSPEDGIELLPPGASIETLDYYLDRPASMAFDPQGRLFFTEKQSGAVRIFQSGQVQPSPVITFAINGDFERGLLGITMDPNFSTNHYIYIYYTCAAGINCQTEENRVVRFFEHNGVGSNPTTIFASPQTAGNHVGGNMHFGPDGKLYVTVGDNANPANAQDVTVKNGKIHRINPDGSIPNDNPVFTQTGALPSLYAMGLRNSYDFAFDPLTPGRIFASENGPGCDDELNRIVGGYNYGWRDNYPCDDTSHDPEFNTIPPLWYLPEAFCCEAPTAVSFYTGNQIPAWRNQLFMSTYNRRRLRHIYLDNSRTVITATNIVSGTEVTLDMETGPDGALYYIEGGGYELGRLRRVVGTRLVGHVNWQGRPAQPNSFQQVPITLTLKSGSTEVNYPSQFTDASGFFTVGVASLPAGTYNWRVKGEKFLAITGTLSFTAAPITRLEMGTLRTGDATNSNNVDAFDFIAVKVSFAKMYGDPNYDDRADFDGNEYVNAVDFNLLKVNFGLGGADTLRARKLPR